LASKWMLGELAGGLWIQLAQDKDRWRTLVNMYGDEP
jgi:hypothetical protein